MKYFWLILSSFSLCMMNCISNVGVDNAPCPCGDEFRCCPSLSVCLEKNEICPDQYPPSSNQPCERDINCPKGERCASWSLSTEESLSSGFTGPRTCRQDCSSGLPCAEGESCAYSLHDGKPTDSLSFTSLCLVEPSPECNGWICKGCQDLLPGETHSIDRCTIQGCLVAVHNKCGLTCHMTTMYTCDGLKEVVLCDNFPCENCLDLGHGATTCQGDDIVACYFGSPNGSNESEDCNTFCVEEIVTTCESGCDDQNPEGAVCLQ